MKKRKTIPQGHEWAVCLFCGGCGEGPAEGTKCLSCGGNGEIAVPIEAFDGLIPTVGMYGKHNRPFDEEPDIF